METTDELPDYPNLTLPTEVPKDNGKYIPRKKLVTSFAVHMWYKIDERLPVRDETVAILRKHVFNDGWRPNHSMLDKFEKPNDRMTDAIVKGLSDTEKTELIEKVERWYSEYLNNDDTAKERVQLFSGFRGRMPRLALVKVNPQWPHEAYDTCQNHHILLHYALANWYEASEGVRDVADVITIARPYYKFKSRERKDLSLYSYTRKYQEENDELYQKVWAWAESLRGDLKGNIDKVVERYRLSEEFAKRDPIAEVTQGMEGANLTATAGPSRGPLPYDPARPDSDQGGGK